MKKSSIWLLTVIMAVAFAFMAMLQFNFVRSQVIARSAEFDSAVHRAIGRVAYLLERDEIRRFLGEASTDYRESLRTKGRTSASDPAFYDESPRENLDAPAGIDLEELFQDDNIREKYRRQSNLLNSIVIQLLEEAHRRPLEDRLDYRRVGLYLDAELYRCGLGEMDYYYQITDKAGFVIYATGENLPESAYEYSQELFQSDPGSRHPSLSLAFPDRSSYVTYTIKAFIPSMIIILLLAVAAAFALTLIWRGKVLSDMKSNFINNMTHELKTPVSSISLASQLLSDKEVAKTPALIDHVTQVIGDESKRLNLLIEKVLQMSIFDHRSSKTLKYTEIDINELIETVASAFDIKAQSVQGSLRVRTEAHHTQVIGDELHLTNVVFNLLDNAFKYRSPERPLELEIHSYNQGQTCCIDVVDNGIGIRREHQGKLFDRFYRVPSGDVHDVKGFGLGLAYVKAILHQHHGHISVSSEWGKGTTFTIVLPTIKN